MIPQKREKKNKTWGGKKSRASWPRKLIRPLRDPRLPSLKVDGKDDDALNPSCERGG